MTKTEQLRKKATDLKEQIRKIDAAIKQSEDETFVKLGTYSIRFLRNEISTEQFKAYAEELGVIEKAVQ